MRSDLTYTQTQTQREKKKRGKCTSEITQNVCW